MEQSIDLHLAEMLHELEVETLARGTRMAYAVTYHADALMLRPSDLGTNVDTAA